MKAGRILSGIILIGVQAILFACYPDYDVSEPTFDVTAPTVVKFRQVVDFSFSGSADMLTFSPGEDTSSIRVLKTYSDAMPASFEYEYATPGVYEARFTAVNANYNGREEKQVVRTVVVGQDSVRLNIPNEICPGADETLKVGVFVSSEGNYPYSVQMNEAMQDHLLIPMDYTKMYPYSDKEEIYMSYYPYSFEGTDMESIPLSLPKLQLQDAADSVSHLMDMYFMISDPIEWNPCGEMLTYDYSGLFSMIRLNLSQKSDEDAAIRIKELSLNSESDCLAFSKGTVSLTTSEISVETPDKGIDLKLTSAADISSEKISSFYMLLMPGVYDDLTLKLLGADNSVAEYKLEKSSFERNACTNIDIVLSFDDFVGQEPFEVYAPELTAKVGQEVKFTFKGVADNVIFWPGVEGHDYAYSKEGRIVYPDYYMSFGSLNVIVNGTENAMLNPLRVLYSTDCKDSPKKADIEAATWTDVSSSFVLDDGYERTSISAEERSADETYVQSGELCINSWMGTTDKVFISFRYESDINRRTLVYLKNFKIEKSSGTGRESYYEMNENNIVHFNMYNTSTGFIWYKADSNDSDKTVLRLASNKIVTDMTSVGYAVAEITLAPYPDPVCDMPVIIKTEDEDFMPEGTSYVFDSPGIYHVVFEARIPSMTTAITKKFEYDITIE